MANKITQNLMLIQNELKAPKGNYNSFGGYKYRSCENILEAVKPLLQKYELTLTLSDSIEVHSDRVYVKATATLTDGTAEAVTVSAYAREAEKKKGMDESQITGTASSYARKYALNGLFCIDDAKDADTDEYTRRTRENTSDTRENTPDGSDIVSAAQAKQIAKMAEEVGRDVAAMCDYFGVTSTDEMTVAQYAEAFAMLTKKGAK